MSGVLQSVIAADKPLPQDIGKAGPLGLLLLVLLLIAVALLVRSMSGHLKNLPRSFDADDDADRVPDSPAELVDEQPGGEVLDELRRRPLAIEPPRTDDGRPEGTPAG